MKTLYTLAYPEFLDDGLEGIEEIRRLYDPQYALVLPHFTMVCASDARIAEGEYLKHIRSVCRSAQPFQFVCRYVMFDLDARTGKAYACLVPDEGFSNIARLHDSLYRGVLAQSLRLDIPYIPHITIASNLDPNDAKNLCDELNTQGAKVTGRVGAMTVAALENARITDLATFEFR